MRGGPSHSINGRPFDMGRLDFAVRLGTTESWTVRANGMAPALRRIAQREAATAPPDGPDEVNDRGPSPADLSNPMWGRY